MSREQKFRAWNGDRYIELNNLRGGKTIYFSPYDLGAIPPEVRGNVVLEQCTGLKDLNDKEICAGDIVKQSLVEDPFCNNFPSYIVCWDKEFLGWSLKDASGDEGNDTDLHFFADNSDKIEVIGNIHENPELLEEK